jgi:predicted TIM-barrel fold metal-dependent hydrolase
MQEPVSKPVDPAAPAAEGHAPAVDCHFHVFAANDGVAGARYRPTYDAPLVAWQALATASGIARGVLVQTSFMGTDNRALLQTLAQAPSRLRGIAVLDPASGAAQVDALHAQGVRGLRLNLVGQDHDVSAWVAAGHALWDAMQRLGWHLQVHSDVGLLPGVLRQLPAGLPLVLDHFARPAAASAHDATVRAVAARVAQAPVHIKLSAAYRLGGLDRAVLARLWLAELGADRLLWGSDWPCTNHESHADYPALSGALDTWLGEETLARQVRVDNPAQLYWP